MSSVRSPWAVLALVCAANFLVILDVAIVNVALPSIQRDLGFTPEGLQWVVSAYALTFGGLLLLGGRSADLLGRRRVFVAGVAVFTAASLACGLAQSEAWLVAARAVQGVGAALVSPTGLSIVSTTFAEGAERNRALGIWGAVGGGGAAAGVLLGGVLTEELGWEWVFLVNVPVGLVALAATPGVLPAFAPTTRSRLDAAGGALVTASLAAIVFALVEAPDAGWGSARTIAWLAAGAVGLAAFAALEARLAHPLVPGSVLRRRPVTGAGAVGVLQGALVFATFLLLSLYMQQALGFSALEAGLAYLTTALVAIPAAAVAQALSTRVGEVAVLVAGLVALTAAQLLFTGLSPRGSYVADLLPGMLTMGVGVGASFVAISVIAVAGADDEDAGLASGVLTTAQQLGGALGVAVLTAVAVSQTEAPAATGAPPADALTGGFADAFAIAAVLGVAAVVLAVALLGSGARRATADGSRAAGSIGAR